MARAVRFPTADEDVALWIVPVVLTRKALPSDSLLTWRSIATPRTKLPPTNRLNRQPATSHIEIKPGSETV